MYWLRRLLVKDFHPRHRNSLRWRIAQATPFALFAGGLTLLISLAFLMAVMYAAAETPDPGVPQRKYRLFWLTLDSLRALLGVDNFPRQGDNAVHQVLATFASLIGSIFPALVIGIAVVRLFTIRVFVWRTHVNACLAAELDDELRLATQDKRHAFLAVRWYKRLANLSLVNLKAEAYLRLKTISAHDGSTLYRYQLLKVLGLDGTEASACVWPETFFGMPFTLWIPLHAGLVDDQIVEIQGRRLIDGDDRQLVVRLSANIAVGPTTQVSEERRYHLRTDVQTGRFVPVDPDLELPVRSWPGWRQFDQKVTHRVFVYGILAGTLGADKARPARLIDWELTWRLAADNTDPDRRDTYYSPGAARPEPIQVLFPVVRPKPGATTRGLVIEVSAEQLAELDQTDGAYRRLRVNDEVLLEDDSQLPGVVWLHVGRHAPTDRADRAIAAGTARISAGFLEQLNDSLAQHGEMLAALERAKPKGIAVEELERRPHEPGQ